MLFSDKSGSKTFSCLDSPGKNLPDFSGASLMFPEQFESFDPFKQRKARSATLESAEFSTSFAIEQPAALGNSAA